MRLQFVYAPLDNIHRPEEKTVVSYVEDSLEPGCCGCDYLKVFKFQSTGGWADASQSVCGGSEYQKWESDDMVMILFRSDDSRVGRGFHLVHSHDQAYRAKQSVVCGGNEYQKWESDDMVMILFHSDTSDIGQGFHIVHSHELTTLA
ncbi:hypothetical protein Ocin01_19059 [Orchesella cincta]|uniref:CUB domain-containing protein n=1 Tax=Orchesella cincta TaxID=48709 RepID=A0A1D2M3S4_ORCCI|nr:hypothetical protein Ocin01_19059 [Orchesella cincta]